MRAHTQLSAAPDLGQVNLPLVLVEWSREQLCWQWHGGKQPLDGERWVGCTSLCMRSGASVLLQEGGHLPLVRTLGWPQLKAEEGQGTPNVLQTPGSEI